MKKILLILLTVACCYACKKDSSPDKKLLLSKVYEDGLLKLEYLYDSDKKPQRRNSYSTGTGQSVFNGFRLYQYANGLPKEVSDYNKDNQFYNRYTLQYDVNNRPTRLDYYNSANTLVLYYTLDYNVNGKISGYTATNVATNKKSLEGQFTYDQHGQVAGINRYNFIGLVKTKYDSTTFVFENKAFPDWWSYYEIIPIIGLPNGDKTFFDMHCTSSFYYYVDAPPSISEMAYSNKKYNNEGLITEQQVSRTSTNIGAPVVTLIQKTYEYTE
jgi:hypothetical protein